MNFNGSLMGLGRKKLIFNPKQAGGGGGFLAPPPVVFFCPSTLIFDTITVTFCEF